MNASRLCGWAGFGLFAVANGARLSTLLLLLVLLACNALRGHWQLSRGQLAVLAALLSILAGLMGVKLFPGSAFESSVVAGMAVGLLALQSVASLGREEGAARFISVLLAIVCSCTQGVNPILQAALWGVQLLALACALRLNIAGAHMSKAALLALLLSLLAGAAILAANQVADVWLYPRLSQMLQFEPNWVGFKQTSQLDTMKKSHGDLAVLLRYRSAKPPRYLVGTVYVNYTDKSWKASEVQERFINQGGPAGESVYPLYRGSPPTELPTWTDEVEVVAAGQDLFIPRDCYQFDLIPSASMVSAHQRIEGTVHLLGDTFEAGDTYDKRYRLLRSPLPFVSRWSEEHSPYLQFPDHLSPIVARLAREHSQAGRNDGQKAVLLEKFLQDNYTYGFDYPFSDSSDPVGDFLEKKPAAHCELFATALTLMLRSLNIPARYVNGYVVREPSGEAEYWTVRGRDAHAWVEAYLDGQWVTLDPTPPGAQPASPGWMERAKEWLSYRWSRITRLDFGWVKQDLPTYVLALGLTWLAWRQRRRLRWTWNWRPTRRRPSRGPKEALPLILDEFQKVVGRLGWVRPAHITLAAWTFPDHALAPVCRRFLDLYSYFRYGMSKVTPEDLERLRAILREVQADERVATRRP